MRKFFAAGFSSALNVGFFFVRTVVLAKILTPHNFGVSVLLLSVYSAIELMADMGWEKFLVRAPAENELVAEGVVHRLRLFLGLAMSAVIVLAAYPVSALIGDRGAWPAFAALAVPVIVRCSIHMNYKRWQRDHDYTGEARVEGARGLFDLLFAIIGALLFGNYWAMVFAVSGGALAACVMSRSIARTKYSLAWDKSAGAQIWRFGRPLLLNNFILYAAGQGDRYIIISNFSASILASYSTSMTFVAGPQAFFNRVTSLITLPTLLNAQKSNKSDAGVLNTALMTIAFTALLSVPLVAYGPALIHLVYGQKYETSRQLFFLLCLAQSMIVMRSWIANIMIAFGRTDLIPYGNMARLAGIGIAVAVAVSGASILSIISCIALGETVAFLANIGAFWSRVRPIAWPAAASLGGYLVAWAAAAGLLWLWR